MSVRFGARPVISGRVIKHCLCISREICTVPSLYRPSTDGLIITAAFPLTLAQFPDAPQFRTAGWFCVAAMESVPGNAVKPLSTSFTRNCCCLTYIRQSRKLKCTDMFVTILVSSSQRTSLLECPNFCNPLTRFYQVPLYIVLVGGLKGVRYVVNEVLLNPIASDSFGFRNVVFFIIFIVGGFIGMILL